MFSSGDYQKGTKTFNNEMLRLLNRLKTQGIIKSTQVYDSMKEVDRGDFSDSKHCYEDWYINVNQVLKVSTIMLRSQHHICMLML
jgi:hypothetical protein